VPLGKVPCPWGISVPGDPREGAAHKLGTRAFLVRTALVCVRPAGGQPAEHAAPEEQGQAG